MKKILISLAAVASVVSAAAPAAAQPFGFDSGFGVNAREARASNQIMRCVRQGTMSWHEARALRGELARIERIEWRMRQGGLSPREAAYLNALLSRLEVRIRRACRPDFGYGYNSRFEQYGQRGDHHRGDRFDHRRGDRDDDRRGGRGHGGHRGGDRGPVVLR